MPADDEVGNICQLVSCDIVAIDRRQTEIATLVGQISRRDEGHDLAAAGELRTDRVESRHGNFSDRRSGPAATGAEHQRAAVDYRVTERQRVAVVDLEGRRRGIAERRMVGRIIVECQRYTAGNRHQTVIEDGAADRAGARHINFRAATGRAGIGDRTIVDGAAVNRHPGQRQRIIIVNINGAGEVGSIDRGAADCVIIQHQRHAAGHRHSAHTAAV